MREIKFRAWNNTHKYMDYEFFIQSDGSVYQDAIKMYDTPHVEIESVYNDFSELMQYTGLKDKNGKEIYEGDIVNTSQGIAVLVWDDLMWCLKFNYKETPQVIIPSLLEIEVIGNIHQNPELIK